MAVSLHNGEDGGPWWRSVVYQSTLLRRKHDVRRFVLLGALMVVLCLVLWAAGPPGDMYRPSPSAAAAAAPEVPGQCTTWPVDRHGEYEPQALPAAAAAPARNLTRYAPRGGWRKPAGIAVKGLVFYGRRRTVDFLDCYLQQNLAANGGYLDEVWFMVHTDDAADLAWLEAVVAARRDGRYKIVRPGPCQGSSYGCIWDPVVEDDTIYVKIDDDIVFIHPDAIPQLVHTRIEEPEPLAVSANLVNSPLTGYLHYETGAVHAFLPDPAAAPSRRPAESWRPADAGAYPRTALPRVDFDLARPPTAAQRDEHTQGPPPYPGHPWLLLADADVGDDDALRYSPMGVNHLRAEADGYGTMVGAAWASWKMAAQQQYSLLQNLAEDAVWRYAQFGGPLDLPRGGNESRADPAALRHAAAGGRPRRAGIGDRLLDTRTVRYNLNFVALWGHDVRAALPIAEDDEEDFTVAIPRRTGRPFVIDARAVVGHLSFYPQHEGIRQTDLLDRWRAFANEHICAADNPRTPFDLRCPGF
ncbi:hypothetical protein F4780DRAFT_770317 [Xylariomycetidae sp. FL0641]|nr:hypothetical protein F4780DRAFT_770317 [Xylariomycetidae sp. FL0641]